MSHITKLSFVQLQWWHGLVLVSILTLAYPANGEGTSNTLLQDGEEVVAVGMKGLEAFRTEFGLNQASGPRYFGFDIDYVPIEEWMS